MALSRKSEVTLPPHGLSSDRPSRLVSSRRIASHFPRSPLFLSITSIGVISTRASDLTRSYESKIGEDGRLCFLNALGEQVRDTWLRGTRAQDDQGASVGIPFTSYRNYHASLGFRIDGSRQSSQSLRKAYARIHVNVDAETNEPSRDTRDRVDATTKLSLKFASLDSFASLSLLRT